MPASVLIVTDHRALVQLAMAAELDSLLLPDTNLLIPDAVRDQLISAISRPGAVEALEWIRENEEHLSLRGTQEYEEYLVLKKMGSVIKGENREEQAAAEILGREMAKGRDAVILLVDDAAGNDHGHLFRQTSENVVVLSASAYLNNLKANQVGSLNWLFRRILALGRPSHD